MIAVSAFAAASQHPRNRQHLAAAAPSTSAAEVAQLRERCEALECRCEALEQALYGAPGDRLTLVVPRHQQTLLALLMRQPLVTIDQGLAAMEAAMPSDDGRPPDNVHVAAARLRVRLRQYGATLHNQRYLGYWLTPADKLRLREMFAP